MTPVARTQSDLERSQGSPWGRIRGLIPSILTDLGRSPADLEEPDLPSDLTRKLDAFGHKSPLGLLGPISARLDAMQPEDTHH